MSGRLQGLKIYPATPARWHDIEVLFGENGACAGCWCQWWKLPRKEWEAGKGESNKRLLQASIAAGRKPGLIAYLDREPLGWCALEPRERYPGLARSRILKPVDDRRVWSISCFFVRRNHRRQGISVQLIRAAKDHLVRQGGTILEAYPTDTTKTSADAFIWHGVASAFRREGFQECARRSPNRPILRWQSEPSN